MINRLLADAVVGLHFTFVGFALFGGLLVLRWRWIVWLHVPAAAWAVIIALAGWVCPLTPLENHLRRHAGQAGYDGGFVEQYIMPVLYPDGLTHAAQIVLGLSAFAINVAIYSYVVRRKGVRNENDS